MKRINQLITRLLIVALVALAVWIGRAQVSKQALVYHLQTALGSRVNVGQFQLSSGEESVFLGQVEVADPYRNRKNMLQFGAASFDLDLDQLLRHRRLVIEDGRLSQIKIGTPRTTSGKIPLGIFDPVTTARQRKEQRVSSSMGALQPPADLVSYPATQKWRDSLVVGIKADATPEDSLQLDPILREKTDQWVERFKEPSVRISEVETLLTMVEELFAVPVDNKLNPLRLVNKFKEANVAIDSSKESLKRIGELISKFEAQAQRDLYELSQVQMRDRQSLVSKRSTQKFDSGLINEILLGDLQRNMGTTGLKWFQQFRESIPNPDIDFRPIQRGRDLYFGTTQKPGLEIKNLKIDGAAEFAGSHFNFAGVVKNIRNKESKANQPVEFSLRAQGDPQIVVAGKINRTKDSESVSVYFTGHSIPQPDYVLGSRDSVQISMGSNSRLHVEADLKSTATEQLSGTITFNFENVMLHADSVFEGAGGKETAARLNETVSSIESIQITSQIGGTIANPTSTFVSDLGTRVASALESVFIDREQLVQKKREHRLNRTIDGDVAALKKSIADGIAALNKSWRANYGRLNRLQKQYDTAEGTSLDRPGKFR